MSELGDYHNEESDNIRGHELKKQILGRGKN